MKNMGGGEYLLCQQFRYSASAPTLPRSGRRHSPLTTRHLPLSSLECALPKNRLLTPLECALPKSLNLKSFRMNTSEKTPGGGGLWRGAACSARIAAESV